MAWYNDPSQPDTMIVSHDVLDKMLRNIKDRVDRAKKGFVIVETDYGMGEPFIKITPVEDE